MRLPSSRTQGFPLCGETREKSPASHNTSFQKTLRRAFPRLHPHEETLRSPCKCPCAHRRPRDRVIQSDLVAVAFPVQLNIRVLAYIPHDLTLRRLCSLDAGRCIWRNTCFGRRVWVEGRRHGGVPHQRSVWRAGRGRVLRCRDRGEEHRDGRGEWGSWIRVRVGLVGA